MENAIFGTALGKTVSRRRAAVVRCNFDVGSVTDVDVDEDADACGTQLRSPQRTGDNATSTACHADMHSALRAP